MKMKFANITFERMMIAGKWLNGWYEAYAPYYDRESKVGFKVFKNSLAKSPNERWELSINYFPAGSVEATRKLYSCFARSKKELIEEAEFAGRRWVAETHLVEKEL